VDAGGLKLLSANINRGSAYKPEYINHSD